jgi:phospholipid-binding lipoprotein MlaA
MTIGATRFSAAMSADRIETREVDLAAMATSTRGFMSVSSFLPFSNRAALTASAAALAVGLVSGNALAGAAPAGERESTAKPTMNFVGSFQASPEQSTGPRSSLLAKLRQAAAAEPDAETVITPASLGTTSRALTHDIEVPAELDDTVMVPESLVADVNDPFEPINRAIFGFNEIVDLVVLRPVSHVYRRVVPQPLRTGVANALHNFATPVIFANDLLQGRPDRATTTAVRFLVNSTAGFGGLVDAAAAGGLPRHSEDFGQTLAVWGARPGAYIVLPVLGPSNVRDTVGLGVDTVMHPATWLMWDLDFIERSSPILAYTVSTHEAYLDEAQALRSTSPDFYATVRDIYAQRRAADIANSDFGIGGFDEQGFRSSAPTDATGAPAGDGISDDMFDSLPPIPTE